MGAGIAQLCATRGLDTLVHERDVASLEAGQARVTASLRTALERGKITAEAHAAATSRLSFTTRLSDMADRDLVIEAVSESEDLKVRLFADLDAIVQRPDAVLASNTSSIPIMTLGAATSRPDQVIGMHFFNPVPVMDLVELTGSLATGDATWEQARRFAEQVLGRHVIVSQDRAGFVVNALLVPYLLAAVRMFEAGYATADDIDEGMVRGCAHPMGPLALCDHIGLDTVAAIAGCLYAEFKEPQYIAPPLLTRMVKAGQLGRKTAAGFYRYGKDGKKRLP
ncbi:3-hydroxybutyryl-CoA dehydrogenase [Dactylosporangium sp. CA-233914]|uniref:3-hydroxybutyryl-CoA dehydrogenase n=1 Tax=Dactylosporangium sp. CA-233914 TaxID=3239934 RepID=UPI003D8C8D86